MAPLLSSSSPVDRELIGVCKQSMLALRQQLQQYIDGLYADKNIMDVNPYIVAAANEFCTVPSMPFTTTSNDWRAEQSTPYSEDYTGSSEPAVPESQSMNEDEEITNEILAATAGNIMDGYNDAISDRKATSLPTQVTSPFIAKTENVVANSANQPSSICETSSSNNFIKTEVASESSDGAVSQPMQNGQNHLPTNYDDEDFSHPGPSRITRFPTKVQPKRKHVSSGGSRRYCDILKCPYCDWMRSGVGKNNNYCTHVFEKHSEYIQPREGMSRSFWNFTCIQCSLVISGLDKLRRHVREKHTARALDKQNPKKITKKFTCLICSSMFGQRRSLILHEATCRGRT